MQNCYFPARSAAGGEAATSAAAAQLAAGGRLDGARGSRDELRRAFMRLGVVSGAAGSAYVEMGRTRVVCAVYGPRNDTRARREFSKEGQLVCDFKFAPFADPEGRRERGQDPDELEMSAVLAQALSPAVMLEKLPKCVVSVYVTVLERGGGELAAAINCASLALADAAVEMYDVVAAASAGIVPDGVALDPCLEEEAQSGGRVVLAYMPAVGKVTHMVLAGKVPHKQLEEAVDLCTDACVGAVKTLLSAAMLQAIA